jgi:RNA polymerase sigma-70 factor (ECF subfamily)
VSDLNQKSDFEQLLKRNRGRLTAISRSYAGSDADDLLQEILLQIWRGIRSFEERSSIDTWCYRVALNTAISWRRSVGKSKLQISSDSADIDQIPGSDDGHDGTEVLRQFLRTLSDTDRALVLLYLEDMSGTEMANIMGVSEGTLRVRVHRIKRRLAEWKIGDT